MSRAEDPKEAPRFEADPDQGGARQSPSHDGSSRARLGSAAPGSPWAARTAALSIALAAVLHGALTGRWIGSAIAVVALAPTTFVAARAPLGTFAQRLLTLVAAAAGGAVGWLETPASLPPLALGRGWSAAAIAALFAAAFRAWIRAPEGGFFATFVVGLGAVVACGETRSGPAYAVFAVAYLLLSLGALRAHDDGRAPLAAVPARAWAATALQIALAVAAAGAVAVVLPPFASWSRDRLINSLGDPTTGLGERMVLGSLEGMLQSDEIVARVYGPHTDYLRGAVYDHYQAGQWAASTSEGLRTLHTEARAGAVRVVFVGSGRATRYVLPLGAAAVSGADGDVVVDRFGAARPLRGNPTEARFDPAGPAPDFAPADPGPDDRRMPLRLARAVGPVVREWTAGADTPEAKVDAIARHLQTDFRYSLESTRGAGDPLLDFLFENRVGHCEYFASAMAMLARAAGVPARVVAGYRVAEHNDLGGYDVIREKNAHAWVEVHIAGKGWQTVDATPEDLLPQNRPHASPWLGAAWDVLGTWWSNAGDRLAALSLWQIIVALSAVILVGLAVRRWGQRGRRAASAEQAFFRPEAPPPALSRLLDTLSAAGLRRADSEPIERFARRLSEGNRADAAELLSRYAAFKYGGVGDGESLFREMDACSTRLRGGT